MMRNRFAIALLVALLMSLLGICCAGATADATPLTLDTAATATISEAGGYAYFSFTPSETGTYVFYSTYRAEDEQRDTYGYLYDADMTELDSNDDGGEGNNFRIVHELTAGTPYIFGARYYSGENTGAFDVHLEKYAGLTGVSVVGDSDLYVAYGESATLAVAGECTGDPATLSYRWEVRYYTVGQDGTFSWSENQLLENETSAELEIESVTQRAEYLCTVSDKYGYNESVWINVYIDNRLSVENLSGYSSVVAPGDSVTLSVRARCRSGELTYHWKKYYDDDEIEGATGASYTIEDVTGPGSYTCYVWDQFGNSGSTSFRISIENHFTACSPEGKRDTDLYVEANATPVLEVVANCDMGKDRISYQWHESTIIEDSGSWQSTAIDGATSSTYQVKPTTIRKYYYCYVNDEYGNSEHVYFHVYVDNQLTVERVGEEEIELAPGDSVTFAVDASCRNGDLTYRWSGPDGWIDGATGPSYTVEDISRSGSYYCYVKDQYENRTYVSFYARIDNQLTIERVSEQEQKVELGGSVTLTARASCRTGDLTYRWYGPDGDIDGATEASYTIEDVTHSGWYYCYAYDEYGNSQDVGFQVSIDNQLTVERVGEYQKTVAPGGSATLAITASCRDGDLTYRWSGPNGWIEGATSPSYTVENVTRSTWYYGYARDKYDNEICVDFYVRIDNQLTVTTPYGTTSVNLNVEPNAMPTLEVIADCAVGKDRLSYHWYKGHREYYGENSWWWSYGDPISGATSAQYQTEPVTEYSAYYCYVQDEYGNGNSVYYYVNVDNQLTVEREGEYTRRVALGDSVTMTVHASCLSGDLTYRWADSVDTIEGATGASYTVNNVSRSGWYGCYVTDPYGNTASMDFYIRINNRLTVDRVGSYSRSVELGGSATLQVDASCLVGGLTYRWKDDDDWIDGATDASYTVENVTGTKNYWCYVYDEYGNSSSMDFLVRIDNRLTMSRVGAYSRLVAPGGSTELSVTVTCLDSEGLTYRWSGPDDVTIDNATGTSYTVTSDARMGSYDCFATDKYGNTVSVSFWVRFDSGLFVRCVGDDVVYVKPGEPATLEVEAGCDAGEFTIRWYREEDDSSVLIEGANAKTLTLNDVRSNGTYYCLVDDEYEATNGEKAYFSVKVDSGFRARRVGGYDVRVPLGATTTLAVDAGCDIGSVTYQWYVERDGDETIEGATGATLTLNDVREGGYYRCVVRDSYGNRKTIYYHVWANSFMASRMGPSDVYVEEGDSVTLAVNARCSNGELSFEWYRYDDDSDRIEGAMESAYTLTNVKRSDFGEYMCEVSDEFGNSRRFYFYINRRNSVTAYAVTGEDQMVTLGDTVTLQVHAETTTGGELGYEWYAYPNGDDEGEGILIGNVTGDTYSFTATDDSAPMYRCRVWDSNDSESVYFSLSFRGGATTALTLDEAVQATITKGGQYAFFSYTPAETGWYTFTSNAPGDETDTYGYLYDADWSQIASNDDGGYDYNFKLTRELQAGQTYYFGARFYSRSYTGDFPVVLTTGGGETPFNASIALSSPKSDIQVGEELTLVIESEGIYEAYLYIVDEEGNRMECVREWWDEDFEDEIYYNDIFYTPQTLRFVATGYGHGDNVESEVITVNVTAGGTLAKPTLSVSADDDGVKVAYAMPANADSMRIRAKAGGIQREYWATKSGTVTIVGGKLPVGKIDIQVEATAFGVGYLESTATTSGSVIAHAASKMALPSGLKTIEEEAFAGLATEEFVIPSGCTAIGKRAFADCGALKLMIMPNSVKSIASDAFEGCGEIVFICQSENAAANYAKQHANISYIIG